MSVAWDTAAIGALLAGVESGTADVTARRLSERVPFPLWMDGSSIDSGPDGFLAEYGTGPGTAAPWAVSGLLSLGGRLGGVS